MNNISILGTGMVARILAASLDSANYTVNMGTRDVEQKMESDEGDAFGNPSFKVWKGDFPGIVLKSFRDAANLSNIIINSTAGIASLSILRAIGTEVLDGKILIDVANPLDFSAGMPPMQKPVGDDSLGEQLQREFPNLRLVKALNTMTAMVMTNPSAVTGNHNLFICGNDQGAKADVMDVFAAIGWEEDQVLDLGDITGARAMEMMVPMVMRVWQTTGNPIFNFAVAR